MSYVSSVLSPYEGVVASCKPSWWGLFNIVFFSITILCFPLSIALFAWFRHSREYVVTNRRVIRKEGIIYRHVDEMFLNRVDRVELRQGLFASLFGIGTVRVIGLSGKSLVFRGVNYPHEFLRGIDDAIRAQEPVVTER